MTQLYLGVFLLLTLCVLPYEAVKVNESVQSLLYDQLLNGNQLVRPVKDWATALQVYVHFYPIQISELNSVDQTLSLVGLIILQWRDEFLNWDPMTNKIQRMQVPASKIWTPEFAIYNSANGIFRDSSWVDYDPMLQFNGDVLWNPSGIFTTSCAIDIRYFPFDSQKCQIVISNWLQQAKEIIFLNASHEMELKYYMENSEWILDSTKIEADFALDVSSNVSMVNGTFYLRRRYESYISTILLPITFIAIMAMLVFPLSPESGEKISLGVTMLLAFSVFQLIISESLPKSSEVIPYIMSYVVALMAMNAASIAMTVLVLHFNTKDPAPRLPRWARKFLFDFLGRITCFGKSKTEVHPKTNDKVMEAVSTGALVENELEFGTASSGGEELSDIIRETLKHLKKITKKMESDEEEDEIKGEWRRASRILDCCFFIISALAWLIASISVTANLVSSKTA